MLIPIGAWCRTAWQVRAYELGRGRDVPSYPYDWTITPFSALQKTLDRDFDYDDVLQPGNLIVSSMGSLSDRVSEVIFHHDLGPVFGKKFVLDNGDVDYQRAKRKVEDARSRFAHSYKNLLDLRCSYDSPIIGFVRWIRWGHPDNRLPDAFCNESVGSLRSALEGFVGSDRFHILHLRSVTNKNIIEPNVLEVDLIGKDMAAVIEERQGFDGDGSRSFKGDSSSWKMVLDEFCSRFSI